MTSVQRPTRLQFEYEKEFRYHMFINVERLKYILVTI